MNLFDEVVVLGKVSEETMGGLPGVSLDPITHNCTKKSPNNPC